MRVVVDVVVVAAVVVVHVVVTDGERICRYFVCC